MCFEVAILELDSHEKKKLRSIIQCGEDKIEGLRGNDK